MQNFRDSFFMAVSLCTLIGVGALWTASRRRRDHRQSWVEAIEPLIRPTGLAMSLAAVFAYTVYTPRVGAVWKSWLEGGMYFNGSLVPFRTIGSYLASTPSFNVLVQLLGNVLLFVPLGFFLALGGAQKWGKALMTGVGSAVVVEAWQSLVGRSFDIDDVILNSVGVGLGVSLAWAIVAFLRWRSRRQLPTPSPTA